MMELPVLLQTRAHLDDVLIQAAKMKASDIHLSSELRLSVRQYGTIKPMTERNLSMTEVSNLLVSALDENTSCLSIVNSGEDMDFSYVSRQYFDDELLRFRVNASSKYVCGKNGLSLVFRLINPNPPDADELGVDPEIIDCMTQVSQGLAVVVGPTGSGKTTLLASIIRRRLEHRSEVMITHESPIEFVYDAIETNSVVNQREIGRSGNYKSFYEALVGALRQDPDLILVGEARDRETISAAINGVQTGHALFTTVHTSGVAQTINRMVKEFEAHEREAKLMDIIDSLSIIVYQKLVKTVDGKRVALREYLVFDGEIKDRLREAPVNELFTRTYQALMEKGQTLLMDAKKKLDAGRIEYNIYRGIEKQFEADIGKVGLKPAVARCAS